MYAVIVTIILALSYISGRLIDLYQNKKDMEFKKQCLKTCLKKSIKTININ